jgi:hypothetical protein
MDYQWKRRRVAEARVTHTKYTRLDVRDAV